MTARTDSSGQAETRGSVLSKRNSLQTLDKGLSVVEHLSRIDGDIDLASLTKELQMPKTSLLRLLNTLRQHNFVQKKTNSGRYSLGWALIYLGRAANRIFDVMEFIHPFLEKLCRSCGETANLVFLDSIHAVYVDQVVSDSIIRGVPAVGAPLGLYCTAAGKALMSWQPEENITEILDQIDLTALTRRTITEPQKLRRELQRIRDQGYAIDDEETELGGCCVAAPVFGQGGELIGAISVMGPTNRVNLDTIPSLSAKVRETAMEISRALGHRET